MPCENDLSHKKENYCSTCFTCHDCIEESDKVNQKQFEKLKKDLQNAIDERNLAWFQLEENKIEIKKT